MSEAQKKKLTPIQEAVQAVMTDPTVAEIKDNERKYVTEKVIENQLKFNKGINEASDAPTNQTGGVSNFDPVLIKMVRRNMPQLIAFDLAGVQPMTGPTGSIFAMRARYTNQTGNEALFNEADSAFSGTGTQAGDTSGFAQDAFGAGDPATGTSYGTGMDLSDAEVLGSQGNPAWAEMGFTIERIDVSAKSRKLKAQFSQELQYDLKNIHGLDASTELSKILGDEIRAEMDREMLRTINVAAQLGAQNAGTAGRFDVQSDADGRWLVEKFKGLLFQMELEANAVGKSTRRGKANRVVCSSNVASALNMAGFLDFNSKMVLNVDEVSTTYAGVLLGRYHVYIDPYATTDYITVGYKGNNAWDAGVYFCPYLPLEMYRSTSEDTFNPKIGFATRYGIIANPFEHNVLSGGNPTAKAGKGLGQGENSYFRKFAVANIAQ